MVRTRPQSIAQHRYVLVEDLASPKEDQTVFVFRDLDNLEVTKIKDSMLGLASARSESEQREGLRVSTINLQSMAMNMMIERLVKWERLYDGAGKPIPFPRASNSIKDVLGCLEERHYNELVQVFGTPDGRGRNELPEEIKLATTEEVAASAVVESDDTPF